MIARIAGLTIGVLALVHNTNFRTKQTDVGPAQSALATFADSRSATAKPVQRPLRGDFPEYRPGARVSGRETFWR